MAELASLTVEVEGRGIKETTAQLQRLGTQAEGTEQQTGKLGDQTKKVIAQLVLEGQAAGKTSDEVKILKLQQNGATKAQLSAARAALKYKNDLVQQAKAADQAAAEQRELAAASSTVAGRMGMQRNGMQLVSYQLQDVAVQAQMGTSAFTIFAQQGPQIASAFGPAGAAAGALIAFGAIGAGLVYTMLSSAESVEELEKKVRDLGIEFNKLSKEQQALIRQQNDFRIEELTEENARLAQESRHTGTTMKGLAETMGATTEETQTFTRASNNAQVQMQLNQMEIDRLTKQNEGFSSSVATIIEQLEEQAELTGLSGRAYDLQKAILADANDEQILQINLLYDIIEGKERDAQASEDRADALDREAKALEKLTQAQERNAEKRLKTALTAAETPIQGEERRLQERLALLEQDRVAAIANAEETGASVLDIELQYMLAREQLIAASEDRIGQLKAIALRRSLLEQMKADRERMESQRNVTNSLLAFEERLLQGKSETTRAAARIAINLANQEKRENATKIISDSYSAAMGAYKALSGIPIIGPALGAAAAGTIIAAGATYAAQSLAGRATGGQVRDGQTYLVGERGPELLTMGTSGRISSNDQLKQAMGGGESVQIVNNIDARGAGPEVETKIRQAMRETSEFTIAKVQDLMRRRRFV